MFLLEPQLPVPRLASQLVRVSQGNRLTGPHSIKNDHLRTCAVLHCAVSHCAVSHCVVSHCVVSHCAVSHCAMCHSSVSVVLKETYNVHVFVS